MNTQKVGDFIHKERKKMNLTQKQLADMLNITDKAVSRWETGKGYPDIEMLVKLSDTFNVSVNELLNGERVAQENISKVADEQIVTAYKKEKNTKTKSKIIISIILVLSIIFCCIFSNVISNNLKREETILSKVNSTNLIELTNELEIILNDKHNLQLYDVFIEVICSNYQVVIDKENNVKLFEIGLVDLYNRIEYFIEYNTQNKEWMIIENKIQNTKEHSGTPFNSIFEILVSIDFVKLCEKHYPDDWIYDNIMIDSGISYIFSGKDASYFGNSYLFEDGKLQLITNTKTLKGTYYTIIISPCKITDDLYSTNTSIYIKG